MSYIYLHVSSGPHCCLVNWPSRHYFYFQHGKTDLVGLLWQRLMRSQVLHLQACYPLVLIQCLGGGGVLETAKSQTPNGLVFSNYMETNNNRLSAEEYTMTIAISRGDVLNCRFH